MKYWVRIVKGALLDPGVLEHFPHKVLEVWPDSPNWNCLIGVELEIEDVVEIQKYMVKHYDSQAPWYMDGRGVDDERRIICAFGADDGEGGRIFEFDRNDKEAFKEVKDYALSKGIPEEQFDFLNQ